MKLPIFCIVLAAASFAVEAQDQAPPRLRMLQGGDDVYNLNNVNLGVDVSYNASKPSLKVDLSACFSGMSTVEVLGKGSLAMKDLQVGDEVFSGNAYEFVYAWAHLEETTKATFLQIHTASKNMLEITAKHMVFVDGKADPIPAIAIQIGDSLGGSKVTKIGSIEKTGLYAPLTASGSMMVDGIKVSSYITLQESEFVELRGGHKVMSQHTGIHVMLSPFRMICMGVSSKVCKSLDAHGMPHYIRQGISLAQWANELPLFIQSVLLVTLLGVGYFCMAVESILGASYGPIFLAIVAGLFAVLKAPKVTVRARKLKTV